MAKVGDLVRNGCNVVYEVLEYDKHGHSYLLKKIGSGFCSTHWVVADIVDIWHVYRRAA